jgi:hypothetical protein
MIRDQIIEEVRGIRRATEEACGHDWEKLIEHYRQVKPTSGRIIRGKPRQLPPKPAAKK